MASRKSCKVTTYSGKLLDLCNPDPNDFLIEDIAHHLSCIPRWHGSTLHFYSHAQSAYYLSTFSEPDLQLAGLLIDAPLAYTGLIPHQYKSKEWKNIVGRLASLIAIDFGLSACAFDDPRLLDSSDRLSVIEAATLLRDPEFIFDCYGCRTDLRLTHADAKFYCWPPEIAEKYFLDRFRELKR